MQLDVVNNENQKVGTVDVNDEVFGGRINGDLMWESVVHANAADRSGTHAAKTRAFVSGTGKKPWKQKGTGRAQVGSSRTPLWRHGGTVHGPQPRDYTTRFPAAMRKNAIKSALAASMCPQAPR
jgi:large subunit ribosomal protein L4